MEKMALTPLLSAQTWRRARQNPQSFLVAAVALAACLAPLPVRAANKSCPLTHSVMATFSGAISNDLSAPYVDGVDGVECVFFDPACGGSGDMVFDTNGSAPGGRVHATRNLCFDFSNSPLASPQPSCFAMWDTLPQSSCGHGHIVLGVRDWGTRIYSMAPGQYAAAMQINASDAGVMLRYGGAYSSDNLCSTPVLVTAYADQSIAAHNPYGTNTWIVTTTAAAISPPTGDLAAVFMNIRNTWTLTDFRHIQPLQIVLQLVS
jgi:hypothetical protein